MRQASRKIPVPVLGAYRNIFAPSGALYDGPSPVFERRALYPDWVVNDFSCVTHQNTLHIFGITHPRPADFISPFDFDDTTVHAGEDRLFHVSYTDSLSSLYAGGKMTEHPPILSPSVRPNERADCWAPCAVEKNGLFHLIYGPGSMRLAVSPDLFDWTLKGELFSGGDFMRDAFVFLENGLYHMLYVDDHLYARVSDDLIHWSEPRLFQRNPFPGSSQESPALYKRHGLYYLFWCLYDGRNGAYDERTFVFASETLDGFGDQAPIALLRGHAPELLNENGKDYLISVFYPENGLNMAPVEWICE